MAPGGAVTLGQRLQRLARPVASGSSNHARSRAIALISAGSHRALWLGCASPGYQLGFDTAPLESDCLR
jgi:hypothetical protein